MFSHFVVLEMENFKTIYGIFLLFLLCFQSADSQCVFPTAFQSSTWTSTNFDTMTFTTTDVTLPGEIPTSWTCQVTSGDRTVIRTTSTVLAFGLTVYYYYCLDLTKENDYSYYYYLQSPVDSTTNKRLRAFESTTTVTDVGTVCTETLSSGEYNVMIKAGSESSAREACAFPLQGNFLYTYNDGQDRCGTGTGTGKLDGCTATNTDILVFDYSTGCSQTVTYSAAGTVWCVVTINSGSTYYQTVYNTDASVTGSTTYRFTCIAMTYSQNGDGNITVSASQRPDYCEAAQTPTTKPTDGALLTLTSEALCQVTTTTTEATTTAATSEDGSNTGLIVGVVVGIIALILIVAAVLICYWCWMQKKKNSKIIHVEENMKPTFEDPDRATPLTRDAIDFNVESPGAISAVEMANGNLVSAIPNGTSPMTSGYRSDRTGMNSSVMSVPFDQDQGPTDRDKGTPNDRFVASDLVFTEKPGDLPPPNQSKLMMGQGTMVIFNGEDKILSGNESRVITNGYQDKNSYSFGRQENVNFVRMESINENKPTGINPIGGMPSPTRTLETVTFPTYPRESSNLFPPIETSDVTPSPRPDGKTK